MVSNRIRDYFPANSLPISLGVLSLGVLYAISRYNFLVFHCLAEAFSIVIAIAVFAIFWNTRQFLDNSVYLVVGLGCLFAGLLDLIYIFAYPGMSVFPGANGNLALQAKTVAQWYVSLSCVCAVPFLRRKIDQNLALLVYGTLFSLALASIFYWRVFPDCFIEGRGITPFERLGLVISCTAYLVAIVLLVSNQREFDSYVFKLLAALLISFFVQDFACAVATELNGFARATAHLCQIIALYFLYKAFVEVGLRKPYDLLFRSQRKSAEGLRLVLEAADVGWWDLDLQSRVLMADDRCKAMMGLPPATDSSLALFLEQISRDDRARIQEQIAEAMVRPGDYDGEYRVIWPDGSVHWLFLKGRAIYDNSGRPCLKGIAMDVTAHRRAEDALRESEQRNRVMVETVPYLAWRASADGLEVQCNQRWYEYTGQTPDQVRAHGWLAAVHPDDLFGVVERTAHAAIMQEPYEIEYRLRRASDGSYRWHLTRAVPILDSDDHVTSWVGATTDIEDLKQAQEILRQTHDEQLQKHRAELAHVARLGMMGEMTASIAHELNQPLYAVKNYAYGGICRLREMSPEDGELIAVLEQINEEAGRAADIIRRIKAFLQKREPRSIEISVTGLIEDAILLSRMEIERFRAKVVIESTKDLPAIVGDPVQIEQVIINLLRNGLEAMDGMPDVNRRLCVRTLRHDKGTVRVDVCDAGKGIGEADLEKVFEPFFTTKSDGMGMGLAISRSIIQAHGGRLWATVNRDEGCTFHFTVPVDKKETKP